MTGDCCANSTAISSRAGLSAVLANVKLALLRPAAPMLIELRMHLRHLAEVEQLPGRFVETAAGGTDEKLAAPLAPLKAPLDAALAGTRPLGDKVDGMRPLVRVVDDDALARQLIARAWTRGPMTCSPTRSSR
jgi:hypothetical protein